MVWIWCSDYTRNIPVVFSDSQFPLMPRWQCSLGIEIFLLRMVDSSLWDNAFDALRRLNSSHRGHRGSITAHDGHLSYVLYVSNSRTCRHASIILWELSSSHWDHASTVLWRSNSSHWNHLSSVLWGSNSSHWNHLSTVLWGSNSSHWDNVSSVLRSSDSSHWDQASDVLPGIGRKQQQQQHNNNNTPPPSELGIESAISSRSSEQCPHHSATPHGSSACTTKAMGNFGPTANISHHHLLSHFAS